MSSFAPLSPCVSCGASKVRIINSPSMTHEEDVDVRNGRAVLIRHRKVDNLPRGACLNCQPEWNEVNNLGIDYHDQQFQKEKSLDSEDMCAAIEIQSRQREVRTRIEACCTD